MFWLMTLLLLGCGLTIAGEHHSINFDNIVFLSRWTQSGKVQLVNGEYREPIAPGSAAQTMVKLTNARTFGTLEGREVAAVVLVTDPGGSGVFSDLALLVKEPQGWVNETVVFLGDRINIHSLVIADNEVVVDMTTHGSGDAMCCPTHRVVQRFVLQENRLIKASEKVRGNVDRALVDIAWRWQQTVYNNDGKKVPPNPEKYTPKLLADGKVSIRSDCNLGGGVFALRGSEISVEITHTTGAACPPESLGQDYIRDLNAAARYFLKDDILHIDLKAGTGAMRFVK
jgi:heat shock protein HslJ